MSYKSFEELDVWKRSCKLAVKIYFTLKSCREFGLRDQINKAAVSIPSNVAEGAERDSVKEFIHFLHFAKGSASELRTQLFIAENIGIIDKAINSSLVSEIKEISSMLHGLINFQKQKIDS